MVFVDKLDDFGKPAWIAVAILGFAAWWPIGLAVLAFVLGSGRMGMGCWNHGGRWQQTGDEPAGRCSGRWQSKMQRMQEKMERLRGKMDQVRTGGAGRDWGPSSGNRAFDDYRSETLRRLEDEQQEFKEFLKRLRFAKDRAEFDQFMAERRNPAPDAGPAPQPQN